VSFTTKDWRDYPETTTPLSAAALEDMETRLAGYADSAGGAAALAAHAADPTSHAPRWGDPSFRQVPIVMCHTATAVAMATLLDEIRAWGYTTIHHDTLYSYLTNGGDPVAAGMPDKPILIGFDDGGASNFTDAYPELLSRGMKATMYLVPDWMDDVIAGQGTFLEATHFSWANAVTMFASGLIDFQSHSMHHLDQRTLGGVGVAGGDGSAAGADFLAAKARIEQMIPGTLVRHQAQPYGSYNAAVVASLRVAGCRTMRTVGLGLEFDGSSNGKAPLAVVQPTTDPMLLPVASPSDFAYLEGLNWYGLADLHGNMVKDGMFRSAARGWTKDAPFSVVSGVLPDGSTGNFLRATPVGSTVTAYPYDMVPIGFRSLALVDGWFRATAGVTSPRIFCETWKSDKMTASGVQGASPSITVPTANWTYYSGIVASDGTWMYARPKVAVGGSGGTFDVWNLRVMRLIAGAGGAF
jgi:peptidoglycan/xylan/chitin deacetylase (PgdA/CDA1 family)